MRNPILVTGAAGRVGAVGRTVVELLLQQGKAVRAMVRNEDGRALLDRGLPVHLVSHLATIADLHRAGRYDRLSDVVRKNAALFDASATEVAGSA